MGRLTFFFKKLKRSALRRYYSFATPCSTMNSVSCVKVEFMMGCNKTFFPPLLLLVDERHAHALRTIAAAGMNNEIHGICTLGF